MISSCRSFKAGVLIRLIYSEYKRDQCELAYRIYVTDTLQVLTENTASFAGGSVIKAKYSDIINPQKRLEEKKSGDEIVIDIVQRAGLELV